MGIKIGTLENTALEDIYECFIHSFADYIMPLKISYEQFIDKISRDGIVMKISAGAFANGLLAGFILHGMEDLNAGTTIYNGGTGVRPEFRGRGLTGEMYRYLWPVLKQQGGRRIILEVIKGNSSAVKAYKKTGFTKTRDFICFIAGEASISWGKSNGVYLRKLKKAYWPLFMQWWDFEPSWPNHVHAIERLIDKTEIIIAESGDDIVAYAVYNPSTGTVFQFAVNPLWRGKGIAGLLFRYMAGHTLHLLQLINIDASSAATIAFLKKTGFVEFVKQEEMEKLIT